jgi:gluconate/galactonate dehydratase
VRVYCDSHAGGHAAPIDGSEPDDPYAPEAYVAAACRNFLAMEYHARDVEWWSDLVDESLIEDGRIELPEKPGLGVELDMDVVEADMVEGETLFEEA